MGRPKKLIEDGTPIRNDDGGVATEQTNEEEKPKKLDEVLPNDNDGEATELDETESTTAFISEEPRVPKIEDIGWLDYVMSLFEPEELDDGYPKRNGLCRLVRKVFGPVLKSYPHTVQVPTPQNMMRATVEYNLVVLNRKMLEPGETPYEMHFADVADAYIDNIKGDAYVVFPTANASTRAEVRALRKILNIEIVAAEELPDPSFNTSVSGEIPDSLVSKIDIKCAFLNIDLMKYINMGRGKPGKPEPFTDIKEVPWALGQKMFNALNVYQQDISKGKTDVIPAKIVGYKSNWRVSGDTEY
jgi:hypothetical protein